MKYLLSFILIASCSFFPQRKRERELQTKIISEINQQSFKLAECVKNSQLFNKFKQDRIRIVLFLSIDSRGQIEKFKLDDQKYPEAFSECAFKIIDSITFPKLGHHELIELEQPFIFSKK